MERCQVEEERLDRLTPMAMPGKEWYRYFEIIRLTEFEVNPISGSEPETRPTLAQVGGRKKRAKKRDSQWLVVVNK